MIIDTTKEKVEIDIEVEQLLKSIGRTAAWMCSKYHDTYSGTGYLSYACPDLIALIKEADGRRISSASIMERVIRGIISSTHAIEQRYQDGSQFSYERSVDFENKRPMRWQANCGPCAPKKVN